MSNEAIALTETIRTETDAAVAEALQAMNLDVNLNVHIAGATAQMHAIRTVTQKDFRTIVVLVLGVIFGIVFLLLRDVVLTAFMVAATVLSYLATLGLCTWAFEAFFGDGSMDWKVQTFLFVVIAAVGVDYNIFLTSRLAQEARRHAPREAVRRALIHTGPVISSCGLIMAATLGSLMVGKIVLLVHWASH